MAMGGPPTNIKNMHSVKIDNLSSRIDKFELKDKFAKYGEVGDVFIPRDDTGQPRSYGFVRFLNRQEAEEAADRMDGKEFGGENIKCQLAAVEKTMVRGGPGDRPRGRSGDRGGRGRGGRSADRRGGSRRRGGDSRGDGRRYRSRSGRGKCDRRGGDRRNGGRERSRGGGRDRSRRKPAAKRGRRDDDSHYSGSSYTDDYDYSSEEESAPKKRKGKRR